MKCESCMGEVREGRAKCPFCGFPVVQIPEMEEEEREHVRSMGREYLRRKLEVLTVGITAYSYAMEEEGLTLEETAEVQVAGGSDLKPGVPVWLRRDFQRLDQEGEVVIHAFLRRGDHEKRMELPVQLPKISGPCRIGVCLEEGLRARFLLGDADSCTKSAQFSLMD